MHGETRVSDIVGVDLKLDTPNGQKVFYPGDDIKGRLSLKFLQKIDRIDNITIELCGFASVIKRKHLGSVPDYAWKANSFPAKLSSPSRSLQKQGRYSQSSKPAVKATAKNHTTSVPHVRTYEKLAHPMVYDVKTAWPQDITMDTDRFHPSTFRKDAKVTQDFHFELPVQRGCGRFDCLKTGGRNRQQMPPNEREFIGLPSFDRATGSERLTKIGASGRVHSSSSIGADELPPTFEVSTSDDPDFHSLHHKSRASVEYYIAITIKRQRRRVIVKKIPINVGSLRPDPTYSLVAQVPLTKALEFRFRAIKGFSPYEHLISTPISLKRIWIRDYQEHRKMHEVLSRTEERRFVDDVHVGEKLIPDFQLAVAKYGPQGVTQGVTQAGDELSFGVFLICQSPPEDFYNLQTVVDKVTGNKRTERVSNGNGRFRMKAPQFDLIECTNYLSKVHGAGDVSSYKANAIATGPLYASKDQKIIDLMNLIPLSHLESNSGMTFHRYRANDKNFEYYGFPNRCIPELPLKKLYGMDLTHLFKSVLVPENITPSFLTCEIRHAYILRLRFLMKVTDSVPDAFCAKEDFLFNVTFGNRDR